MVSAQHDHDVVVMVVWCQFSMMSEYSGESPYELHQIISQRCTHHCLRNGCVICVVVLVLEVSWPLALCVLLSFWQSDVAQLTVHAKIVQLCENGLGDNRTMF